MKKVYVREEVCVGRGLCRVYCQISHYRARDQIKSSKREAAPPGPRIRIERKDEVCFPVQC
ncbi:MAG: hypothetical protein A2Y72_05360 [Chloroflexi bacterium RBG_13_53_26]|nr:MAG: hypothetical protein A2Y72_05360 [Chloroflexi bacterium RBG_13_53_26]